jgi:hypothetical protein
MSDSANRGRERCMVLNIVYLTVSQVSAAPIEARNTHPAEHGALQELHLLFDTLLSVPARSGIMSVTSCP